MKKLRFLSAVIAISMLFSATVFADFSDMPQGGELKAAIENAVANGLLSGFEDGTVRPDAKITRAQMASIITRACGVTDKADISEFSDVPADSWYHSAFASAYYMGAFSGDEQKLMHPQNNITFQECFTILSQVFDLVPPYTRYGSEQQPEETANTVISPSNRRIYDVSILNNYSDGSSVANWAKPYVAGVLYYRGWSGENGCLTPTEHITRGQFARVMNNLIQNYIDTPGTYTELPAGNTMIRCSGVMLDKVSTTYDIYVADCVEQGGLTMDNITVNRFVVRGAKTPLDENNNPINDNFGIVLSGTFGAIRFLAKPYISADISNASYDPAKLYSLGRANFGFGVFYQ